MRVFLFISTLTLYLFPLSQVYANETIKVGFFGIFTGAAKVYGQVALNSAKLAVEEINEKKILNRKMELVVRDTKSDPAVALTVARDLVKQDVDMLVGFHTSDERLAVRDYIEGQNKLYLYTAIYEGGGKGKWTFYSGPVPNQIYGEAIPYLAKKHNLKNVYLVGSDYSYAQESHKFLNQFLKKNGLNIVGEKLYPFPTTRFDVESIVAAKPDLIISNIVGEDDLLWTMELQKHDSLMKRVKIFSGLKQDPVLAILKDSYRENYYSAYPFSKKAEDQKTKKFMQKYLSKFGSESGSVGQGAYDSMYLLADAIKRSKGKLDVESLSKSFIGAEAEGTRGRNKMLQNHHVQMNIYVEQGQKNKEFKIVKQFKSVEALLNK